MVLKGQALSKSIEKAKALRRTGEFREALEILDELHKSVEQNSPDLVRVLNEKAMCFWRLGDLNNAWEMASTALNNSENIDIDVKAKGITLKTLGNISWRRGELEKAEKYLEQNIGILVDPEEKAQSLNNLGAINLDQGLFDKAESHFQESLNFYGTTDSVDRAFPLNNLGLTSFDRGRLIKAEEYFKEALKLFEKIGNPQDTGHTNLNLALVSAQRGKLDEAENYIKRSLECYEKVGNREDIACSLNSLAMVYERKGELDLAKEVLQRGIEVHGEKGSPDIIADLRYRYLRVLASKGLIEEARLQLEELTRIVKEDSSEFAWNKALYHLGHSVVEFHHKNLGGSLDSVERAIAVAASIPHFELQVEAMQLQMIILLQIYQLTGETQFKEIIVKVLDNLKNLSEREGLYSTYAETILMQGLLRKLDSDLQGAMDSFEQAKELAEERGMVALMTKAETELQHLTEQMTAIRHLLDVTPEVFEQLQIKEMENYLRDAEVHVRATGKDT